MPNNLYLDSKYVDLLGSRLRNFRKKANHTWNFSCPYCGDSIKNKRKARGYVYENKNRLQYHCHNCNITQSVENLVLHVDSNLHSEYAAERIKEKYEGLETVQFQYKPPEKKNDFKTRYDLPQQSPLKELKKISSLYYNHQGKRYVEQRKIPTKYHNQIFYVDNFYQWANKHFQKDDCAIYKKSLVDASYPRLVIPFLDTKMRLHAIQARSLHPSDPCDKYITLIYDDRVPKIYNLVNVNLNKKIKVVEGPIDCMFLDNAIATAGGDCISTLPLLEINKEDFLIVYDNEPRNRHTIEKIHKALLHDYEVVIWPDYCVHKDINDMILAGWSQQNILDIISRNTYKGIMGLARLASWKRTD